MINEYALNNIEDSSFTPTLEADCKINCQDVSIALAEDIQILEPFGVGNPIPNFVMYGVNVNEIASVSDGKHTRFSFGEGKNTLTAMYFSNTPASLDFYTGDKVDLLFNIDINEWMGRRSVQLIIKDIRPSAIQDEINAREVARFEEIWCGAHFKREENILPDREDFAAISARLCVYFFRDKLEKPYLIII